MKYLKNNAEPQTLTIYNQRSIEYYEEAQKGKFVKRRIDIAMHREGRSFIKNDPVRDPHRIDEFAIKHNLSKFNKLLIHYKNDRFVQGPNNPDLKPVSFSFTVVHYPHIVGFKRGEGIEDEREYNLLVGEVVKVENDFDAEDIIKTYHFVDEVNEKGEIIMENPYRTEYKPMEVDIAKVPKSYEERTNLPGMKQGTAAKPIFKESSEATQNEGEEA